MSRKNEKLELDGWARHEEEIAALPGVLDIGVGHDAVEKTGLSGYELGDLVRDRYWEISRHGAVKLGVNFRDRTVDVYVYLRGRSLDIGTREDFHEMGWDAICDLLDKV